MSQLEDLTSIRPSDLGVEIWWVISQTECSGYKGAARSRLRVKCRGLGVCK